MNVCDATKLVYGSVFRTPLASERKKENSGEIFQKRLISEDEHAAGAGLFLP
jgi:hypothetical protein